MSDIVSLNGAKGVKFVGGKAAALATLLRQGFKVPPGFVITAHADLGAAKTQVALLKAFDSLGTDHVAVRSSAVNEDGASAAWAGQLDTFLNVTRDELIASVKKCRQSMDSKRAKAYASEKGISSGKVAVLVQAMVDSEVSGVAFSVHPVSNNRQEMVIEAVLGLGEALVSGHITPDTYIVAKTGEVKECHVANQTKQSVRGIGGTTWAAIKDGARQKLDDRSIVKLAKQVVKLEKFFGFPVDVEWGWVNKQLYILQSRPITTLG